MRFLVLLAFLLVPAAAAAEPPTVAVFDLEIIDTSGEPVNPDHEARLVSVSQRLRQALAESGQYDVVDLAPFAERIGEIGHIYGCNGCERRVAAAAGAELTLTGIIRKVSTLVASIELVIEETETGRIVGGGTADIRGDTDEAWRRGVDWLTRNRLLAKS